MRVMAKKRKNRNPRRRSVVYYNSGTDTWSNDNNGQMSIDLPYLIPGTAAYEAVQEQKKERENMKQGDEFHEELEESNESLRDDQLEKTILEPSNDIGTKKFRRRISKETQNGKIERIVENGLNRDVDIDGGLSAKIVSSPVAKTCHDELYDDSIDADHYAKEVIRDYESDFDEICKQDKDNNGEEDDWTPGMSRMAKYM